MPGHVAYRTALCRMRLPARDTRPTASGLRRSNPIQLSRGSHPTVSRTADFLVILQKAIPKTISCNPPCLCRLRHPCHNNALVGASYHLRLVRLICKSYSIHLLKRNSASASSGSQFIPALKLAACTLTAPGVMRVVTTLLTIASHC